MVDVRRYSMSIQANRVIHRIPEQIDRSDWPPLVNTLIIVLVIASLTIMTGCSDPDLAIFARMSEAEQARFRSGRQISIPCWTCHDLAGTVKKVGPSLQGIYGRRSGIAPDYEGSPAMITASIEWDDRSLAAFLREPNRFVPGNWMVSPGVRNPGALSDLLFYLRHVTPPDARTRHPR